MDLFYKLFVTAGISVGLLGAVAVFDFDANALYASSLSGMIYDENGDGIGNASVTIKSKGEDKKKIKKTSVTDLDGFFEIEGLKKGKYKIKIKSLGFEKEGETLKIKKKQDMEKEYTLNFASYTKTNDTEAIDDAVSAFQTIGSLRREDPINGDDIAFEYEGELQNLTQEMDSTFNLTLDSDISTAIEDIVNGNEPELAAQVLDKTLQRVFFLTVLDRITDVRDDFDHEKTKELQREWDEAYAAYQALFGTADRDNKVLTEDRLGIETGTNPNLEDQITVAFIRGREALEKKDIVEDEITVGVQRQVIRLSLVRAFYIAVLREVEGILENRDDNVDEALEKQKEGEVYYRIIEEFVSRDNLAGSEIIKSQLTGNLSDVVADTIVSEMSKGFIGRVLGELESNESNFNDGDRGDAMVVAEEALLYSNVFLEDLGLRLGMEVFDEIEEALNELKMASDQFDETEASEARQVIEAILTDYSNELL